MSACTTRVTYTCYYCGNELTTVDGIPDKNSLKNLVPDRCPFCGAPLKRELDLRNAVVEYDLERLEKCKHERKEKQRKELDGEEIKKNKHRKSKN